MPEVDGNEFTPKPTRLIERILQIATQPDSLVLDAFAGSGTTGHAVLKQNARDGGNRRFVLVEMEADVAQSVTAERVRRASEGYAYEGTDKTELYRQKLTWTQFKKADAHLKKIDALEAKHASAYDAFKREIKKDYLTLHGVKRVEGRMEGLGGGFRFARLGATLFDATGALREQVGYADLSRLVFFLATGRPLEGTPERAPLLGRAGGVAVYLLYNGVLSDAAPGGGNVLTRDVLEALPDAEGASERVVYGASTPLSSARLAGAGVTFRQIPYALGALGALDAA